MAALLALLSFVSPCFAQDTPPEVPEERPAESASSEREVPTGLTFPVTSSVDVVLHGFARIDYGIGDRFGDAAGEDQLGVSKMALVTEARWEDFSFVGVIGATILADQPVDTELKDIFVMWKNVGGTNACLRVGAEPLLFGLKPAGYPGDRTIVPSLEFGGAGAFPVSNQAGTCVVLELPLEGIGTFQSGIFDTAETTAGAPGSLDGSGVYRNYFGQVRLEDVAGVAGLYGVAGYEGRYVGQTSAGARVDETESIFDVGVGFRSARFDLSLEYVALDEVLTETAGRESYWIEELTLYACEWTFLADYASASELDARTLRIGAVRSLNEHVSLQLEVAHDTLENAEDVGSAHVRLAFTY